MWSELIWLRRGTGSSENHNEPSGAIKYREFLDYLSILLVS
jgi:hypothetical protein